MLCGAIKLPKRVIYGKRDPPQFFSWQLCCRLIW